MTEPGDGCERLNMGLLGLLGMRLRLRQIGYADRCGKTTFLMVRFSPLACCLLGARQPWPEQGGQKSLFPMVRNDGKHTFPKVLIFDGSGPPKNALFKTVLFSMGLLQNCYHEVKHTFSEVAPSEKALF